MGHVRDYSIGDAYARFRRARGDAVLLGFGFDAFGLPAELAAIERQEPPADWVAQCGERMLGQMKRLGFSFDYDRVFYSSDESQYRWSQWLFLTLLEAGLIYSEDATVDWCDTCQTTLASIQVEDGRCWRCHNEVRLIRRPTWFLRITPYLEENDRNTERLQAGGDWDELSLNTQRYILGRSDGVELDLEDGAGETVTVFSPHAGALGQASFVLVSPRHPRVERWVGDDAVREALEQMRSGGWERSARDARSVPLVDTGAAIAGPGGKELPLLVSPLVDARYGPTAAFGVPAVDEADAEIAARVERVAGAPPVAGDEEGDGQPRAAVAGERPAKRYRANDFSISRQRSWGTPIPVIHCEPCGAVPVPVGDLPVVLPRDIRPTGEGNPLAERPDFVDVPCPRCGAPAKRETDTLDCHFDALWLWVPAAVPPEDRDEQMFTHPELREWLPSERLVAGNDSGGFVFDQRVVTKALRDIGPFEFMGEGEPFAGCLFHDTGMAIHRTDHESYSLFLAADSLPRLLESCYDEPERSVVTAEALHAIIGHRRRGEPITVEAGIVRVADALDMAKGRSRIPFERGSVSIHSLSAAAIDDVEIKDGEQRPILIEILMNNSSGIYQVDGLLKAKLSGSGLEPYVEVVAHIDTEAEKRLVPMYRLEI